MSRKQLLFIVSLLLAAMLLAACAPADQGEAEQVECPEVPPCPECPSCPESTDNVIENIPYAEAWASGPHADAEAEAFNHWNEDDPAEVEQSCAQCHSTTGYLDYMGEDGSEFGVVDAPAPIGEVIQCEACHNPTATELSAVTFPSGVEITGLGESARCMVCHQGRATGANVVEATEGMDPDAVSEDLGFINIHYYAAAATLFGSETHAGYEYEGKGYQIRFGHVDGYTECVDCHNPHTLEIKTAECARCHDSEEVQTYRMQGSLADYDGDGDREEGVAGEIIGLQEALYGAIQAYAADAGNPIVYESHTYPYFFNDSNGDGEAGEDEANYGNQFASWTPRLLAAAYNYQLSRKDPGAFAHNAKYVIALLYDSIEDLGGDVSAFARNDPGHFDGTAEAFRHWDEDGEVPGSCARCHSAEGIPTFFAEGVNVSEELPNSLECHTCHTFGEEGVGVRTPPGNEVTFPSGNTITLEEGEVLGLCMTCHQGRSSSAEVDASIEAENFRFINIHYFAAGATLYGSEAAGAYQYAGKSYVGRFAHVPGYDTCNECHNVHALEVNTESCAGCHGSEDPDTFRIKEADFDGDGDTAEGIKGEIDTMVETLYAAMQAYSTDTIGTTIVYDGGSYPYFFDEAGERYSAFDAKLMRAAYNYQYAQKDPGAHAHNSAYVMQVLYDSIQDLGGDVSGMTRP